MKNISWERRKRRKWIQEKGTENDTENNVEELHSDLWENNAGKKGNVQSYRTRTFSSFKLLSINSKLNGYLYPINSC